MVKQPLPCFGVRGAYTSLLIDIVQLGNLFHFKYFLLVSVIKFCFCKWHYHVKGQETCVGLFIHKLHQRRYELTTAPDRQIGKLGRAFEHSFWPEGAGIWTIQSSKLQMPRLCPGQDGGGVLKFLVDWRITLWIVLLSVLLPLQIVSITNCSSMIGCCYSPYLWLNWLNGSMTISFGQAKSDS